MSEDLSIDDVSFDDIQQINQLDDEIKADDLQSLVRMILADKLKSLEERAQEELSQIKGRQARMRFLNSLLRLVNNSKDKDDGIDLKNHPELEKLIGEAKQYSLDADKLEQEADQLEKDAEKLTNEADQSIDPKQIKKLKAEAAQKKKEAKVKRDDASEMKDIAHSVQLLIDHKKISREEKVSLVENIRSTFDDLNSINQYQVQTTNRLNNERHETLLMARMIMKTLHESITHMARAASGRG